MQNIKELVGQDLAGMHIEVWYAVYDSDEDGISRDKAAGFFKNKDLGMSWGIARGKSWGKPNVHEIYTLWTVMARLCDWSTLGK